jgi:hypothetical protein
MTSINSDTAQQSKRLAHGVRNGIAGSIPAPASIPDVQELATLPAHRKPEVIKIFLKAARIFGDHVDGRR